VSVSVLIVDKVLWFYSMLLFVYVLLSWFPGIAVLDELRQALKVLCEPYLSVFRRIIPPIGMVDISPIIAFFVLGILRGVVVRLLQSIGT
jgi:YggT family protein